MSSSRPAKIAAASPRRLVAGLWVPALASSAAATSIEPDVVVVVGASQSDGAGGPDVDWGIPVEIPLRVLAELIADGHATVHTVVVRNGIVVHAPGNLDLGRTARLANRAQRRALNALYSTCAIPGCGIHFRYTKMHHIEYAENGGRTDLTNLLPRKLNQRSRRCVQSGPLVENGENLTCCPDRRRPANRCSVKSVTAPSGRCSAPYTRFACSETRSRLGLTSS